MVGVTTLMLWGCLPATRLRVAYHDPLPMPIVQPSTDRRRWYVPMESASVGPHLWFVDTGYDVTNCDDDLIRRLQLSTRGHARIRGELGVVRARHATLPPLQLGGHVVSGITCQVRDLGATSSIRDPLEVPVAGVLGMDVLRRFVLELDPERGLVHLKDPDQVAPLARRGEGVSPLRRPVVPWTGRRVRMPLHVNGRRLWPIVDTGAARTYIHGRRVGLAPDFDEEVTIRGTGVTGSIRRRVGYYEVEDLALGDQPVGPLTLMDRPRGGSRLGQPGLLGLDVLAGFRQQYDFRRRRVHLEPVEPGRVPQWRAWRRRGDRASAAQLTEVGEAGGDR